MMARWRLTLSIPHTASWPTEKTEQHEKEDQHSLSYVLSSTTGSSKAFYRLCSTNRL
jgi:hypothetical protein